MAFTWKAKLEIHIRDHSTCKRCGKKEYLHAAHVNHSRSYKHYNATFNGRILCILCHIRDHELRAGKNGLTYSQNAYALQKLRTAAKALNLI